MDFISTEQRPSGFPGQSPLNCSSHSLPPMPVRPEWNSIKITSANFSRLSLLGEECGFDELRGKLSASPLAEETAAEDSEARLQIATVEEKAERRECGIVILQFWQF
jgi:hypothetical protein